ncbi:MAG: tRNA-dependent cyclodipeptide synthase [Polyangiaceae bacterium]|jgi:cyclo(L-tyrosyl-L-tyrosyl) synthase|nr:tRNA-dependent cyclodipeptide synthase [Polyangiaceae bacterium]
MQVTTDVSNIHPQTSPACSGHVAALPLPTTSPVFRRVEASGGWLDIAETRHRPALRAGLDLIEKQPLVLLGFSPGSGYFSRRRVEVAIEAMAALFEEVLVVVPDTIVEHTYRALGYPEAQVVTKARNTSRNLQNRCQRAIELARVRYPGTRLHMLDWATDVEGQPGHDADVEEMRSLFRTHPGFRAAVLDQGRKVLAARRSDRPPTEAEVEEGVQYLLKEFAFVRRARRQLGRDLVIPYYQDFTLAQGLCDGQFLPAEDGVGWLIYEIKIEGAADPKDGQDER